MWAPLLRQLTPRRPKCGCTKWYALSGRGRHPGLNASQDRLPRRWRYQATLLGFLTVIWCEGSELSEDDSNEARESSLASVRPLQQYERRLGSVRRHGVDVILGTILMLVPLIYLLLSGKHVAAQASAASPVSIRARVLPMPCATSGAFELKSASRRRTRR
jgi:hypothetical protein